MKKVISFIMTFFMFVSMSTVVHAEGSLRTYTSDEYLSILIQEADKYDVEVAFDDSFDYNQIITQRTVDAMLENVREIGTDLKIVPHESSFVNAVSAYASGYKYGYFDVIGGVGCATITVKIYANVSGEKVTSASVKDIYQDGVAFFFQSWQTTSSAVTLNTPQNGYVRVNVSGRASFNISGVVITTQVDNRGVLINCL